MMTITQSSLALMLVVSATSTTLIQAGSLRQGSRDTTTYTSADDYAMIMLEAVNTQRATQGLSPLCLNKKLQDAAQRHSDDMAAKNYMDHVGSDGSSVSDRITQAGYDWTAVAENVAAGQVDVAAVMEAWIQSPGHLKNIMGDYTMFGSAYAFNGDGTYLHYWTQDFASGDAEACDGTGITKQNPPKDLESEITPAPTTFVDTSVTIVPATEAPVTPAPTAATESPKSKNCETRF